MANDRKNKLEILAEKITYWAGSSAAIIISCALIVIWGITGPIFHFSDTWQLILNTVTSIFTFIMVFIIQKSQNKDSKAIQLKLNELIAANRYTSNRMVDIEDLSEEELNNLREFYAKLSKEAEEDDDIHKSHSIDQAERLQERKTRMREKEESKVNNPDNTE